MTTQAIEQMCHDAMARIKSTINRSAGQHARHIEREHARSMNFLLGHASPFAIHGKHGVVVYVTSRKALAEWNANPGAKA
jgi:hypothetical protein